MEATLIATVDFSERVRQLMHGRTKDVKISIKDSDNEVIASAVYDFASNRYSFKNSETTLKMAFDESKYWIAVSRIETSSTSMVGAEGGLAGRQAGSDVDDYQRGGASIADSDVERYAQLALSWRVSNDKSAISSLHDVPTTSCSAGNTAWKSTA